MNSPKVSVVVLTKNEEKNIKNCINSIKKSSYKNIEISVIDSCSTDNTVKIIKNIKGVRVYILSAPNIGFALKSGIKLGTGSLVFIVNGDSTINTKFIERAVKMFKNKDVAIVSGKRVEKNKNSFIGKLYASRFKKDKVGFISRIAGNYMLKKNIILKNAPLDESIISSEEHYLCVKVISNKFKIYRLNTVSMYHNSKGEKSSILGLLKKHKWYAQGKKNVFRKLKIEEKIRFIDQDFVLFPWTIILVILSFFNSSLILCLIFPFIAEVFYLLFKGVYLDLALVETSLSYWRSILIYLSKEAKSKKITIKKA